MFYASDYFELMYQYAEQLIRDGKAYVDSLSAEEIREYRGTLTEPGRNSPYRDRGRGGEPRSVPADARWRIRRRCARAARQDRHGVAEHQHARSDAVPNPARRRITVPATRGVSIRPTITHTRFPTRSRASRTRCARSNSRTIGRCTTGVSTPDRNGSRVQSRPQQIEFARLNLNYTVMSKRKLLALVQQQLVSGWDDPRMPTIAGIRRRGYTAEAVRDFCARIGVAKKENVIDIALLEHTVREDLNRNAPPCAGRTAAAEAHHRKLSRRTRRAGRGGQQSGGPDRRHAPHSVFTGALHRAGRLHGVAAEKVLQVVARK